jgi:hypothetical protein
MSPLIDTNLDLIPKSCFLFRGSGRDIERDVKTENGARLIHGDILLQIDWTMSTKGESNGSFLDKGTQTGMTEHSVITALVNVDGFCVEKADCVDHGYLPMPKCTADFLSQSKIKTPAADGATKEISAQIKGFSGNDRHHDLDGIQVTPQ